MPLRIINDNPLKRGKSRKTISARRNPKNRKHHIYTIEAMYLKRNDPTFMHWTGKKWSHSVGSAKKYKNLSDARNDMIKLHETNNLPVSIGTQYIRIRDHLGYYHE